MTYARSRLWLGMTAVGTGILTATGLLASQIHFDALQVSTGANGREFVMLVGVVGLWAAVLVPFDFIGGYFLPKRFLRASPELYNFVRGWMRGVLVQSGLIATCLWLVLQAGQTAGLLAAVGTVIAVQVGLVASQKRVAAMVARIKVPKPASSPDAAEANPVVGVSHSDSGFTGSIVGLPGFEEVVVPQSWQNQLRTEQYNAELTRRSGAIQSGSRTRGILLAIAVSTLTFTFCTQLPAAGVSTVGDLITALLYFTLMSFIWLLVLPRWSREGVFEADRFALENGVSVDVLKTTAESIESMHDNELARSRRLESVFHPVPCVKRRVAELSLRIRSIRGFWNVARMTLFLSWSCGGFLSRSVHCNIGRPELWVMLPTN